MSASRKNKGLLVMLANFTTARSLLKKRNLRKFQLWKKRKFSNWSFFQKPEVFFNPPVFNSYELTGNLRLILVPFSGLTFLLHASMSPSTLSGNFFSKSVEWSCIYWPFHRHLLIHTGWQINLVFVCLKISSFFSPSLRSCCKNWCCDLVKSLVLTAISPRLR